MLSLFHRKKKAATVVVDTTPHTIAGTVIRTMPEKFLVVEERHHFWTPLKLWTVAIVVVVGLVATSYWLVTSVQTPVASPEDALQPTATPSTSSTGDATGGNIVSETLPTTPSPDAALVPGSEILTNESPAPIVPAPVTALLSNSTDTDGDGLTNVEEALFTTNSTMPDSDADGYSDLDELRNGYNPIGTGKLQDGSSFTAYSDPSGRYSVRYPAQWTSRPIGRDGIQFVSATDESIAILVQSNPGKLGIAEWYRASIAGALQTSPTLETVAEHAGIFAPDRQTFYFVSAGASKDVYVVSLVSGAKTTLDFRATYELFMQFLHLSS